MITHNADIEMMRVGMEISFRTVRTTGGQPHRLEMSSNKEWSEAAYLEMTFLRLM
jgi:hypothetical protein